MDVTVRVPASIGYLTRDNKVIKCEASTIAECINHLDLMFAGLKDKLCDSEGEPLDTFNVYVNGENIRYLQGRATLLKDGDEVAIIPAAAAG